MSSTITTFAWQTPVTDHAYFSVLEAADVNRMEGNVACLSSVVMTYWPFIGQFITPIELTYADYLATTQLKAQRLVLAWIYDRLTNLGAMRYGLASVNLDRQPVSDVWWNAWEAHCISCKAILDGAVGELVYSGQGSAGMDLIL